VSLVHGVDIVNILRFQEILVRKGSGFLERLFTTREIGSFGSTYSFAQLFAAKEAVLKGLGSGLSRGVGWHDIEILPGPGNRPEALLSGAALDLLGERNIALSLSSSDEDAVALAVIS